MKLLCTYAAIVLAGLLGAATARAADNFSKWSHTATIEVAEKPEKGLVEASLPPELLGVAQRDLGDLRLVTSGGETVAYVLRTDRGEPDRQVTYQPRRMFNPVFVPKVQSQVTVDFGAEEAQSGAPVTRTRIEVRTSGTNFRRRVMVEASLDDVLWQVLRNSDWIFRMQGDSATYEKNHVLLPDNNFRYLRITVFNAPDDPERVQISGVTAWNWKSTPPVMADVPLRGEKIENDEKRHVTEISEDLGFENLPLNDVTLVFGEGMFLRRVEILGRSVESRTIEEPVENSQPRKRVVEEPWQHIGGGAVYRLPSAIADDAPQSSLTLPVNGGVRYLQVRIYNGDDAPLKFTGMQVRRLQQFIAFRPVPAGPYRLYAGNPEAGAPQYDLANFAERLRSEGVAVGSVKAVVRNGNFAGPAAAVVPWSERHKWLLWAGLVGVMGVLIVLVVRQARRAKTLG